MSRRCLPACLGCLDCIAMRYAHVQVMMHAGPLQARLQALGAEHMAGLRRAFVASCASPDAPLTVRPAACLLVLRRRAAAL